MPRCSSASHDCLAVFFGALSSGTNLVSVPHPARGMDGGEYLAQIDRMCGLTGATSLLCDPGLVGLLSSASVPVRPFDGWPSEGARTDMDTPGNFVQFTSGSTAEPRGVALTLDAIDANLRSMYDHLPPLDGAVVCSWLPLSHDMGLIGLALYAICSVNPPWTAPTDLVLMAPEAFLADPTIWMRACTDYRATSTTAPPFALRLAARSLRSSSVDLSSLRSFVVGSEPIAAEVVREFDGMAREVGLSPTAVCPGYGMAEATLAVSIDPMTVPWSSVRVDTDSLAAGVWQETGEGGTEVVSCGPPIADTEVRVTGGDTLGELEVRSPSLLSRYVGGETPPLTDDGWFHTADLGTVRAGSVFVVGRTDDVLVIGGRNVDARALDAAAATHPACRPGNVACIPDGGRRYVVIAEPRRAGMGAADLQSGAREIRLLLAGRFAATPSAVVFIERGTLPKTPSGKVRRNHLRALWADGQLPLIASG